ncbi:MAG: hypoxanthine phosphoribosyltransferase [Bacteroidales bacterium]
MDRIKLHDKEFSLLITPQKIQEAVSKIADNINNDLAGEIPLFLSILNGSFMFTSDLLKKIRMNCHVSFLKLSSYRDDTSTGSITELIGLNEDIKGRSVVIVEDIVDTGITLKSVVRQLKLQKPKKIIIATLLLKPEAFTGNIRLDYVGLEIPNEFIIGYGLDYNNLGRNFEGIYKIIT